MSGVSSDSITLVLRYENTEQREIYIVFGLWQDIDDFLYLLKFSSSVVQWLSYLPLDPRFASSNEAEGDKNSQQNFLWKGSTAVCPTS